MAYVITDFMLAPSTKVHTLTCMPRKNNISDSIKKSMLQDMDGIAQIAKPKFETKKNLSELTTEQYKNFREQFFLKPDLSFMEGTTPNTRV